MNSTAERRDPRPRFDRFVLRVAALLVRMAVNVEAWQFRHSGRVRYRPIAAVGLSAIGLLAGALGLVSHACQHAPVAELGAHAASIQRAISES